MIGVALKGLAGRKLRTALTTLGMTIGVAAVIAMVGIGNGIGTLNYTQMASRIST